MAWTLTQHTDADALAQSLADALADLLTVALHARGRAVLALAGGRTPFPLYRRLAGRALDWSKVSLVPTDERWVGSDHPACNAREMRAAFADAAGVRVLPLVPGQVEHRPDANHPDANHPDVSQPDVSQPDASLAEATLAALPEPFDAVVLGMGGDGHFASLFPGALALADGLAPDNPRDAQVIWPEPLPAEAPFARISLTRARLQRCRRLILVTVGAGKRAVLDRAFAADADPRHLPIAALLHDPDARVEIHWSP